MLRFWRENEMNFQQRKKDILSKDDKSSRGKWDEKIVGLCEKINSLENYYTTSSCAGRILLIKDEDEKREDLFLKVWHDFVGFDGLKEELEKITSPNGSVIDKKVNNGKTPTEIDDSLIDDISTFKRRSLTESASEQSDKRAGEGERIKFKQEPCILHVACLDLESAQNLLDKAKLIGWKRSGIIATGKNFVVELISTEKLEFPIISDGVLLVDDCFLKVIVEKSNENLKKSWEKIEMLRKSI